ncbi:MAG: response regulator [Fibrobacterota bacterium]
MSVTVVIIDDSAFVRRKLQSFFEKELGFTVVATGVDGTEALPLYEKHHPDLLTLDIVMDRETGMEAVSDILTVYPEANILMVSAVRTGEMLDCISLGAKNYVEKPLQLNNEEYVRDFKETLKEIFADRDDMDSMGLQ